VYDVDVDPESIVDVYGVDGSGGGLGGAGDEIGVVVGYFLGITGIISKSDLLLYAIGSVK
jgi:hypothetical protein